MAQHLFSRNIFKMVDGPPDLRAKQIGRLVVDERMRITVRGYLVACAGDLAHYIGVTLGHISQNEESRPRIRFAEQLQKSPSDRLYSVFVVVPILMRYLKPLIPI